MKIKLLFPFLLISLLLPVSAYSQFIQIEAEDFTDSHDIAYEIIRSENAPSCSGGFWLVGLDYPEEWVQYSLELSSFGIFSPQLRLEAETGVEFHLRMTLYPPKIGDIHISDFHFTGKGTG